MTLSKYISPRRIISILFILFLFALLPTYSQNNNNSSGERHTARYYSSRAENYVNAKAWESAKREIDAGLEYHPNDPTLRMLNGMYYFYAHDDTKNARYNLIRCLQSDEDNYKARRVLVEVEEKDKHYSSAVCYINELLEVEPYDRDLWLRKIRLYYLMDKIEDADALLERLARIYPNDTIVRQNLLTHQRERHSNINKKQSLLQETSDLEEKILEDPTEMSYYISLMGYYYKLGEFERAIGTANRALDMCPKDPKYEQSKYEIVRKAAGIMTELGQYSRALEFVKRWRGKGPLYKQISREAADNVRLQDPYEAKGKVYMDTKDLSALNWLVNTSITRGYYEDAKMWLRESYLRGVDSTQLMLKEYNLEKRFGTEQGAFRILQKLRERRPEDDDLAEEYALKMLSLASTDMNQEQWFDATIHLQQALTVLTPDNESWASAVSRLILCYGHLNDWPEAREVYYDYSDQDETCRTRFAAAYEEVATQYIKDLIAEDRNEEALMEARALLRVSPNSEYGLRTCINRSQELGRFDLYRKYTFEGYEKHPDDPYFIVKYGILLHEEGESQQALSMLHPLALGTGYIDPQLRTAFSGVSDEYAIQLMKKHEPEIAMAIVDTALYYDPKNKGLLSTKGYIYENMKDYKNAIVYQSNNFGALLEQRDWMQNMNYLYYKSFRNRIEAAFTMGLYNSYSDDVGVGGIAILYSLASLAYAHQWKQDALTLQVSYKGIDGGHKFDSQTHLFNQYESGGIGLEFMAQWDHNFKHGLALMLSGSYSTRYFNKFGANIALSWAAPKGYTPSLKLSYRRTSPTYLYLGEGGENRVIYEEYNLFMLTPSLAKDWDKVSATITTDLTLLNMQFYYNVGLKGRFFVNNDHVSSVALSVNVGSFPELTFYEQTVMPNIYQLSAMLSGGIKYLITQRWVLEVTGTWNTYYDYRPQTDVFTGSSRNIFGIDVRSQVLF